MSHPLSVSMSVAVGVIALGLGLVAVRAWQRVRDARLLYLVGAFGAFMLKAVVAVAAGQRWIGHNASEITGSALDLTIVILLVAPFLHRQ